MAVHRRRVGAVRNVGGRRVLWRALPALGFGIVLALAFDQAVRLLFSPTTNQDYHWYVSTVQYHPVLGWSGYPHFASTKDGIRIQTNSLGYRDQEPVNAPDGKKLGVLVLGDSDRKSTRLNSSHSQISY